MKICIVSDHYKLVPHWSYPTDIFHYHLVLTKAQKPEVKGRNIFRNSTEIQHAELNEELTALLMYGMSDGARYIEVEIAKNTLKEVE